MKYDAFQSDCLLAFLNVQLVLLRSEDGPIKRVARIKSKEELILYGQDALCSTA
jgi:hypothetical protein